MNDYSSDEEGYKIHPQLVVRDANGHLVSVIESTNTGVLAAYLPDGKLVEGFVDYMFERKLQNNYQIVTVDNTKYEKVVQNGFHSTPKIHQKTLNICLGTFQCSS